MSAPTTKPATTGTVGEIELTILMPCLNEAETLEVCIKKAQHFLETNQIRGEVIIADNGSDDGSQEIATRSGARLLEVRYKGYGSALLAGIDAAKGKYVIMGDADDSYDFSRLQGYIDKLREGFELVMGNRFAGGIAKGAMPPLHRYFGNPVLTGLTRFFFQCPIGDVQCGLRGFNKAAIDRIQLRTLGFEFASEMVVKSTLCGLKIGEVPTTLSRDGRNRPPHIRSWRDGWRNLRFYLLYSPQWVFYYPGLLLTTTGLMAFAWLLPEQRSVGSVVFDVHTLFYSALAAIVGLQSMVFSVLARVFSVTEGFLPENKRLSSWTERFTLEFGILLGGALVLVGVAGSVFAVKTWSDVEFGRLDYSQTFRLIIPSGLCIATGLQLALASFFLGVLNLKRRNVNSAESV